MRLESGGGLREAAVGEKPGVRREEGATTPSSKFRVAISPLRYLTKQKTIRVCCELFSPLDSEISPHLVLFSGEPTN
jgi:hypothetical protein